MGSGRNGATKQDLHAVADRLHKGEPVFYLRAQDLLAPHAVEAYAAALHFASLEQGSLGHHAEAARLARASADVYAFKHLMVDWQDEHSGLVKLPD